MRSSAAAKRHPNRSTEPKPSLPAGQPLDTEQRAAFEPLFGHDFSQIRVFADDHTAANLSALAFAAGNDIVLSNRVDPDSPKGQLVLAHELAHTVQHQRFGQPGAQPNRLSQPDDAAELEAHTAAQQVLAGQSVSINTAPSGSISRWPDVLGDVWDEAKGFVGGLATVGKAVANDGFGVVEDFSGAVKREQAREELAPNFQGSQTQLETMAREMAEVRLGREDKSLGLDQDATPEAKRVSRDLALKGLREEGSEGASDIAGVLDRQRAQGELMMDREVIDDDFTGPRSETQITQTELRELARIYSGVRRGQLDPNLGTNANASPDERELNRQRALEGLREEGLDGANDLSGVMDRQAAQSELSGEFNIVDETMVGPRKPNDVTLEEFRETAKMFSDIRLGRGDLRIDGSELQSPNRRDQMGLNEAMFKQATMNDLAAILQTDVGRDEIRTLQNNVVHNQDTGADVHHQTAIKPLASPDPGAAFATVAANNDNAARFYNEIEGHPGNGVNADVRYRPGENFGEHPEVNPWEPFRSDVILFHELRHTMDSTRGRTNSEIVDMTDAMVFSQAEDGALDPTNYSWDHDIAMDAFAHGAETEHETIGLGKHRDAGDTENDYRRERNVIGQLDAPSSLPGDAEMQQRRRHNNPSSTEYEEQVIKALERQEQQRRAKTHG